MTVNYLSRTAWGSRTPKPGPGLLTPSRVKGVVVHWPGSGETDSFDSNAEVASALRAWQAFHMDQRGWSDIAYQIAVDQDGNAWTLRGLYTQSGANGNEDLNEKYGAILLVLVTGEEPSAAMKATVRGVITDFREIYGDDAALILPHSAVRPDGTDCPGDNARAAIARGDFEPWADPPEEDPLSGITPAEIGYAVAGALAPIIESIEKKYVNADNAHDDQAAAWTAVGQAYAAHLLAGGQPLPAETLVGAKDHVWSFLSVLWAKK